MVNLDNYSTLTCAWERSVLVVVKLAALVATMNLKALKKPLLLELAKSLGLDVREQMRKPEIIEAIENLNADDDELSECLELIDEHERRKAEERNERLIREAAERDLEMKRLEIELLKARGSSEGSEASSGVERKSFRMKDLMQPYRSGEDMGLFLVNFERTCEKARVTKTMWPHCLLTLLPCEAAEVIARLTKEEADDYDQVKSSLLKKYRLSAEAFRQKFRSAVKQKDESYADFAYKLMSNMREWLKEAKAFEHKEKIVECFGLEQFYRRLPQDVRLWVQDREEVTTVSRAAELAEDFVSRRALDRREIPQWEGQIKKATGWRGHSVQENRERNTGPEKQREVSNETTVEEKHQNSAFEKRRPLVCYKCHKPGHIAAVCKSPKVVCFSVDSEGENMRLLEPYIRELIVNGKECRVLRDSAATMDVVHPSYVEAEHFTGECAWIKQAAEPSSVCLPIAKVCIEGPFGALHTEAAVSAYLPKQYAYLFSNRSDWLLGQKNLAYGDGVVCALTRSKARELATRAAPLDVPSRITEKAGDGEPTNTVDTITTSTDQVSDEGADENEEDPLESGSVCEEMITPASSSLQTLLRVDRSSLIEQQRADPTLQNIRSQCNEGISKKNVMYQNRAGILYRKYLDRRRVQFDQLVVPERYRRDLLHLAHGSSWSGHLGVKKTKDRLLQEYYWPGCFREIENFVRTCDTCQRVGKPGDKVRAPMKLVPVITEPFRRLVIDTVGPLPTTTSGYRHVLTVICPATKFPEAVPLKELSSVEVVNALLSIFARVGFPAEIQSDQGTVFTSALTTTFLEKCGIRLIHSSVYHPQSNPVEKLHSVMKRVLRALCFERKVDWDVCLPATMFALRTAPHEATGFTPAELVYGRSLRSPLRILRESWEGRAEDPTVVEYVLTLLERLHRAQELAGDEMSKAQARAKRYYDRSARSRRFEAGDQVMRLKPSPMNKLDVQWEGPAEVVQRLSDTNYLVRMPGRRKTQQIYHSNLLKPYREREVVVNMAVNVPEEPPLDFPFSGAERKEDNAGQTLKAMVEVAELTANEKRDLESLLIEYEDMFSEKPGRTNLVVHDIELTATQPVRSKAYRVSPRQRAIIETEIKRMLELDVIEACESDYTSPLILVEVPGKDPRPCVDYRRLNHITKDQTYPIPNIEERIEAVSSAKYISTFDLVRGYWQVPLTERASRYAAFISPIGTYRPKVLSFGLKNAPYCFSALMDKVLRGLEGFALPYLDDVAVFSGSWSEHLTHLRAVLQRFREAGLTVKARKCQLGRAEVTYLGHIVGQGHRRPSDVKVAAVNNFPQPRTKTDVRSFLGLAGYYQHYIPRYSELASPLTDALRKTEPQILEWDEKKARAFLALKNALMSQPVLQAPDYARPFVVQCDASDRGMGVVLCQRNDAGEEHPVLYASRKLTVREEAYSASEKECACVVWAVQKLACYLAGSEFIIETDHCPLTWLQTMSPKNGRLLRWSLLLQQYSFEIRYKRGKLNGNADGLSRCF